MNLLSVSINHRTAPVELREALHLGEEEIKNYIQLHQGKLLKEGLVISTCNRTEIYGIPVDSNFTCKEIQDSILQFKKGSAVKHENFEHHISRESVRHLFKVASGIDSMLIGDNQIFKQVKDSFQIADEMQFTGFIMKRIMASATRVGKRAISETTISEGAVTVSFAAVQLIEKIFSNLSKKSAFVIGTGETGEIAAKHLRDRGIGKLSLTNRTIARAEKLGASLNASIVPFDSFKDKLHEFDIIISATSSDGLILNQREVEVAMKKRNYASMVLMDIALPRDIDPNSKKIDYVFYHDIDSLNIIVDQNLSKRKEEIPKVDKIIEDELNAFFEWYNSLEAAPTIKTLRDHFELIRAEEVEKNINKFSEDDRERLDIVTKRIINKLLHQPTVELKKGSQQNERSEESAARISILRELFGLNNSEKD